MHRMGIRTYAAPKPAFIPRSRVSKISLFFQIDPSPRKTISMLCADMAVSPWGLAGLQMAFSVYSFP